MNHSSLLDVLYFAHLKDDVIMDKIPLSEVELVREMKSIQNENKTSRNAEELMIETNPQGYNSGRTYYLQAESKARCQKLVEKIKEYSKVARERADARTTMAQAQQRVGKIYRSKHFQNIVAVLIISVCSQSII